MNHQLADISARRVQHVNFISTGKVHTEFHMYFVQVNPSLLKHLVFIYSKASPLKFILLFAMLHVLGSRDNFDNTRLQPVQTTLHMVQLVC